MKEYTSIDEVIGRLNTLQSKYVILRNYENLTKPELFLNGHADIDILCEDSQEIVGILDADTNRIDKPPFKGDGTHYYIYINKEKVSLDLRFVGDGYYCDKWQRDMLNLREREGAFYVLNKENYFYSLIYHAILQKQVLTKEYQDRLSSMATALDIEVTCPSESVFISLLQSYMRKKGYRFVYPKDYTVPCRFNLIDKRMIDSDYRLQFIHWRFEAKVAIIALLVKIKHIVWRIGKH